MVPSTKPSLTAASTTGSWSIPIMWMRLSPILRSAVADTTAGIHAVVTMPSTWLPWVARNALILSCAGSGASMSAMVCINVTAPLVSATALATLSMRSLVLGSTRKPVKWAMRPFPPIALISALVPR